MNTKDALTTINRGICFHGVKPFCGQCQTEITKQIIKLAQSQEPTEMPYITALLSPRGLTYLFIAARSDGTLWGIDGNMDYHELPIPPLLQGNETC